MIINFINEGQFGSYKDKLSKEQRLSKVKQDTTKIINDDTCKKILPVIKDVLSDELTDDFNIKVKYSSNQALTFRKDYDPWKDPEPIKIEPKLKIIDNVILEVYVPVYFNIRSHNDTFIINQQDIINEDYNRIIQRRLIKNPKMIELFEEFNIQDVIVKMILGENYDSKYDNKIHIGVVNLNHCNNLKILENFFNQFSEPVHIVTDMLNLHCTFDKSTDMKELETVSKYIKVRNNGIINLEIASSDVQSIKGVKYLFNSDNAEINIRISISTQKTTPGPKPYYKNISDEFLGKYFGTTYENMVKTCPAYKGREQRSMLTYIEFTTDKKFDTDKIMKSVRWYCNEW